MAPDDGSPVNHRFTARSELDDEVHVVNAPLDAVADPSAYTTWCGQPVVEICRGARPATCSTCVRATGGTEASTSTSNAEFRTGEQAR
jgi:hypothetical protein